jgi:hypothetical protein
VASRAPQQRRSRARSAEGLPRLAMRPASERRRPRPLGTAIPCSRARGWPPGCLPFVKAVSDSLGESLEALGRRVAKLHDIVPVRNLINLTFAILRRVVRGVDVRRPSGRRPESPCPTSGEAKKVDGHGSPPESLRVHRVWVCKLRLDKPNGLLAGTAGRGRSTRPAGASVGHRAVPRARRGSSSDRQPRLACGRADERAIGSSRSARSRARPSAGTSPCSVGLW